MGSTSPSPAVAEAREPPPSPSRPSAEPKSNSSPLAGRGDAGAVGRRGAASGVGAAASLRRFTAFLTGALADAVAAEAVALLSEEMREGVAQAPGSAPESHIDTHTHAQSRSVVPTVPSQRGREGEARRCQGAHVPACLRVAAMGGWREGDAKPGGPPTNTKAHTLPGCCHAHACSTHTQLQASTAARPQGAIVTGRKRQAGTKTRQSP